MFEKIANKLPAAITVLLMSGCASTLAPSNYLEYQTKANLIFPLKGESFVAYGGRTLEQNHHASSRDQRFALDVVALKVGSEAPSKEDIRAEKYATYDGDPALNESYYCFGREIVAPAGGRVVDSLDGIPDSAPSNFNLNIKNPAGNYVVIDHGNNEFSIFAHLKNRSVTVDKGDHVKAGDLLGKIGNSGNTTEPHLHYHMQNTDKIFMGEGVPVQFINYYANGKFIKRGEPVQGQIIVSN